MDDSSASLPITRTTLAELNVIALSHPFDLSHLTYVETQQILTLYSLLQYFADRGLEAPFQLAIEGLNATDGKETDPRP